MAHTIGAAIDRIVASPAVDLVPTDTTGQGIVSVTTEDHIVTITAGHNVVTTERVDELALGRGRVPDRILQSSVSVIRQSRHGRRATEVGEVIGPVEILERLLDTGTRRRGSVSGNHQLVVSDRVKRIPRLHLQAVQRERHPGRRFLLDDLLELSTPERDLFPARTGLLTDQLEDTRTSGLIGARKKRDRHTVTGLKTKLFDRGL